jgi:hypothetical protein
VQAALREADEEAGLDPRQVRIRGGSRDDHGGWSYETVVADIAHRPRLWADHESAELSWVPEGQVADRRLHPGFARSWPALQATPSRLVVDAANVVGSTPNGWWRDRAGATTRLRERVADLAGSVRHDPRGGWTALQQVVLVVEGQASTLAQETELPGLQVVAAPGSGDDEIVRQVRRAADAAGSGVRTLVITADRQLRARVDAPGVQVVGPRWLHQLLDGSLGEPR